MAPLAWGAAPTIASGRPNVAKLMGTTGDCGVGSIGGGTDGCGAGGGMLGLTFSFLPLFRLRPTDDELNVRCDIMMTELLMLKELSNELAAAPC